MADHDLAVEPQPRVDKPGLAVPVRGLVQVHEIHVDLVPRQIAIELGVQVQKRLLQLGQSANPHLGGGKRVHP